MNTEDRTGRRPDEPPQTEILRALIGSRAHGTADDDSDRDERVVFVTPTSELLKLGPSGIRKIKDTLWVEDKEAGDVTGWEVAKYAHLALHGNPTILEVLWAPVVTVTQLGNDLRKLRSSLLSKRPVYEAFRGYSNNQRKKMLDEPSLGWTPRNWKFAEAYLRVLYQGTILLETGELPVDLTSEEHSDMLGLLRRTKRGETTVGEVVTHARFYESGLHTAFLASDLPSEPDIGKINDWLMLVRDVYWD